MAFGVAGEMYRAKDRIDAVILFVRIAIGYQPI